MAKTNKEKYRTKEYQAKAKDVIKDLIERADQQIDEFVRDPEKLEKYLSFISSVSNKYSPKNMVMIKKQFPGATILKSFTDWKREGTSIKQGEKGIKILQPFDQDYVEIDNQIFWKDDWTDEIEEKVKNNQLTVKRKLKGFKLTTTFDISQTILTKEEYPKNYFTWFIDEDIKNLDYNTELFNELKKCISNQGLQIFENQSLGQVRGMTNNKNIWLNEHNSIKENVATLLHEYGHLKFKHSYKDTERSECEYQAEMIAYVLCKKLNVDTEQANFDYIKSWVNQSTQKDRSKWMKEVVDITREINNELEQHFKEKYIKTEKSILELAKQEDIAKDNKNIL
ncbi:ImmA/IrrE family metallo-endopeptidase [Mycoplasma putrefaciens]|uniref:ImmA/IrrE family metallo-endopeptidase n=1 Tax=Mycoplasma putrefaciens TaxID=2123 RepID=UPI003DA36869